LNGKGAFNVLLILLIFLVKWSTFYAFILQILFKNSGVKMTPNAFGLQHYRPDKNDTYVVQTSYCRHDMSIGSDKDITCSVTSLFFMKKNDYISVVNVYPDNEYEFYSTTTFLNAFMLKWSTIKPNNIFI